MNVSAVYDYLDEHYSIKRGINAYSLNRGSCPICEHYSGDLRVHCKTEEEFQDLADAGEIKDVTKFYFAHCQHCGNSINFYLFSKFLDGWSFREAKEYIENDDNFVRSKREEDTKDYGMPFPEMVNFDSEELSQSFIGTSEKKKIYTVELCEGLLKDYGILKSIGDFEYKDRKFYCYNRIVFPFWDRQGTLIGFQARAIKESSAKYLMAPYVNKSKNLYGSWRVPKKVQNLVICEGVTDSYAYYNLGMFSVASFGKTLTEDQIQILLDIAPENIYIAWDRDAIIKSFEFCEKYGHRFKNIKIIVMPEDRDADEVEKNELTALVEGAITYDWDLKILYTLKGDL